MAERIQNELDAAQKAVNALRDDHRPDVIRKAFEALLKVMKAFAERLADRVPHPEHPIVEPPTEPTEPVEPTEPTTKPV